MFQTGCVGQLPHIFWIGPGDAARSRQSHRASRARRDHSGFGTGKFREPFACCSLQFKQINKLSRCSLDRLPHARQFQRPAQIRPRPARIDQWPDPKAGINIGGGRSSCSHRHAARKVSRGNGGEERSSGQQSKERSPIIQAIFELTLVQHNVPFLRQLPGGRRLFCTHSLRSIPVQGKTIDGDHLPPIQHLLKTSLTRTTPAVPPSSWGSNWIHERNFS